jgi:transcriptional regulator with XRE-family HTH domain
VPQHPLKVWMEEWGERQEDVAARLGVTQGYVSKIVRGHRKPPRDLASKIAKLTGRKVTVEQLMSYEIPKGAKPGKLRKRTTKAARALDPGKPIELPEDPEKLH